MAAWALIVAAGSGSRMGGGPPKVLQPLAGRPALWWTLAAFEGCDEISGICLVAPEPIREAARGWGFGKLQAFAGGGPTRGASVYHGLKALPGDVQWVAIHDGARPAVDDGTIRAALAGARQWGGAAVGVPLSDTLQRAGEDGLVLSTPERAGLWLVQTPQAFDAAALRAAYARARAEGFKATDDVAVARRAGMTVGLVRGSADNLKLTVPEDIKRLERILMDRHSPLPRVGLGWDSHRLAAGRPLILAGVTIPFDRGLLGHSDADVIAHAVTDAVLGAAALPDIGRLFPDNDPAYEGADSLALLRRACGLAAEKGLFPQQVDAVIIAQQPKLAPYMDEMRRCLARALGLPETHVGLKAKTAEGLGPEGEGLSMSAQAVAVLAARPIGEMEP